MSSADYSLPVLVVAPEPGQRQALSEMLIHQGQSVETAPDGGSAARLMERKAYKLVLAESDLPEGDGLALLKEIQRQAQITPTVLLSAQGDVRQAVEAIRHGAMDYLIEPVTNEIIGQILSRLAEINRALSRHKAARASGQAQKREIVTVSPEMTGLLEVGRSVAPSSATVLISGESGTGKELFARYIHAHSDRGEGPFVAVNCAALPENLLESELFGHEKGAFTGAVSRKPGKFELAAGGTILMDEISEMDRALQAKLLRVLQESEVDRVGGRAPVPVDVRVIATTNREIEEEVAEGRFREDLYYRLNVIPMRLPPLRERSEDIAPLAEHFLVKYTARNGKQGISFAEETIDTLKAHPWRGNVRELENIIERAVLLSRSAQIEASDLMLDLKARPTVLKPAVSVQSVRTIKEMERDMIQSALTQTEGNRTHAAKLLGISVRTLRNKINEYKQETDGLDKRAALGG